MFVPRLKSSVGVSPHLSKCNVRRISVEYGSESKTGAAGYVAGGAAALQDTGRVRKQYHGRNDTGDIACRTARDRDRDF